MSDHTLFNDDYLFDDGVGDYDSPGSASSCLMSLEQSVAVEDLENSDNRPSAKSPVTLSQSLSISPSSILDPSF
jgi:hypothetical protein